MPIVMSMIVLCTCSQAPTYCSKSPDLPPDMGSCRTFSTYPPATVHKLQRRLGEYFIFNMGLNIKTI